MNFDFRIENNDFKILLNYILYYYVMMMMMMMRAIRDDTVLPCLYMFYLFCISILNYIGHVISRLVTMMLYLNLTYIILFHYFFWINYSDHILAKFPDLPKTDFFPRSWAFDIGKNLSYISL